MPIKKKEQLLESTQLLQHDDDKTKTESSTLTSGSIAIAATNQTNDSSPKAERNEVSTKRRPDDNEEKEAGMSVEQHDSKASDAMQTPNASTDCRISAVDKSEELQASKVLAELDLFDMEELQLGRKLGRGSFAAVFEVKSFRLEENRDPALSEARVAARHFCRDLASEGEYAVKWLQPQSDPKGNKRALEDFKAEAEILSRLSHPYIVKVYACRVTSKKYGSFILMDRLTGTLEDRIPKWKALKERWNLEKHVYFWCSQHYIKAKQNLFLERLRVARDLAFALSYLHQRRIVYRDLKPANVGFDVHGNTKLFDFGLARSLPEEEAIAGDAYKMSGRTGTLLYMAPEVWKNEPYNETVDIYAFAHILWEMLALEKPHREHLDAMDMFDSDNLTNHIFVEGARPTLKEKWPVPVQSLLTKAWAQDRMSRPSMSDVCIILEHCIDGYDRKDFEKETKLAGLQDGDKASSKNSTDPSGEGVSELSQDTIKVTVTPMLRSKFL